MPAFTYHGRKDARVETVPAPVLAADDDLILRVTAASTRWMTRPITSSATPAGVASMRASRRSVSRPKAARWKALGDAFDKGLTLKMGQTDVQRLVPERLTAILEGELDPGTIISHRMTLAEAAQGHAMFDAKDDDCRKSVLTP